MSRPLVFEDAGGTRLIVVSTGMPVGSISMDLTAAALLGLVSASFMTLTESPFWKRWGISGVSEWQVNWVELTLLGVVARGGDGGPEASWKVIASHLVHGMAASVVFVVLLPSLLYWVPFARASIALDALAYSLSLWVVFSVSLKRVYEWAGGIRIQRRGILVSLLSHSVYGISLGLLASTYLVAAP